MSCSANSADPGSTLGSNGAGAQPPAATGADSPAANATNAARKRHFEDIMAHLEENGGTRRRRRAPDMLDPYRHAARWIPRGLDPFLDIPLVFRVGFQADIRAALLADGEAEEDLHAMEKDAAVEFMAPALRARYQSAYYIILDLVPGFRDTLDELQLEPARVENLIRMMDAVNRQSRSDDTSSLKSKRSYYLIDVKPTLHVEEEADDVLGAHPFLKHTLLNKTLLGFNDIITGRLLCPARYMVEFDADPIGTCAKLMMPPSDGGLAVTATLWPVFLYRDPDTYAADPEDGLLQGALLVRVYRHIYTSPTTALEVTNKKAKGRASQAKLHGLTSVTARTIAYAACQTRFMLNAQDEWSVADTEFNMEQFFLNIVQLFEADAQSEWAVSTLEWWNLQVFRYRAPLATVQIPQGSAAELDDFDALMARRRARVMENGAGGAE